MSFEQVDKTLVTHDLVQDLKWDAKLRAQFEADQASVISI